MARRSGVARGFGSARASTLVACVVAVSIALVPATASADELPVHWSPVPILAGGMEPDSVAGANDWSCRPAEGARPVVLVHGTGGTLGTNWATMAPLLRNSGFCVFGLTYGAHPAFPYMAGLTRMQQSAEQLAAFVDRVLAETGAEKVDLVGHSQGTIMPRWWMSFMGGTEKVDRFVAIAPIWDGTNVLAAGTLLALGRSLSPQNEERIGQLLATLGCGSCPQMLKGSSFMNELNAAGRALPGVTYTNIVTRYDQLVVPYTSGLLEEGPNVTNHVLQDHCPKNLSEHLAVIYDPQTAQVMLNALAPDRARPVPCRLMLPTGSPKPPPVGLEPADSSTSTCARTRPLRVRVPRRRGERVRSMTARAGDRRVVRRGRSLRTLRLTRLDAGRQAIRLRIRSDRGVRTTTLRRTVRCAA